MFGVLNNKLTDKLKIFLRLILIPGSYEKLSQR